MKKNRLAKFFVSLASLFTLGITACGGGSNSKAVSEIYLYPYEFTILKNESQSVDVTVYPEDASGYKLDWTTSDPDVATVKGGVVTGVGAGGTATITVTVRGTDISDSCTVHVAEDFHDYVHDGSVQLNLDYADHTFYEHGVEEVSLLMPIDGDTAHFKTKDEQTIKARFYGVDTPESTGKVQEWGYEASEFTKEKLLLAKANGTIVVSSPSTEYGVPSPDSTGSRYVSLIWINTEKRHAPLNELYLLNLWIVQEGYSNVKNVSSFPTYEASFDGAYNQARAYKLHMWSDEKAPHWNDGDYQDVSLLDIKREVEASFADESHVNAFDNVKVRFTGVVSSYNDNNLYVQEYYPKDKDDPSQGGEWAGINIFCGMSVIPEDFRKPNTYLLIYGLAKDSENFGFQITDTQGHWNLISADPDDPDCKILLTAAENQDEHKLYTFNYSVAELNNIAQNKNCESLFCSVKVTGEFTCNYFYINDKRNITLGFEETKWNIFVPFMYYGDPSKPSERWDTEEQFMGKKFRVDAGTYAWHKTTSGKITFNVIPVDKTSLVCTSL